MKYYLNKIKKINLSNINISLCIDILVVISFVGVGIFNLFFNQDKISPILLGFSQLVIAGCFFLMMLSKRLVEKNNQLMQETYDLLQQLIQDKVFLIEVIERLSLQVRKITGKRIIN